MPGGSDPTVGIPTLHIPYVTCPHAQINHRNGCGSGTGGNSAGYPLLKVHQQGAIGDVAHEVGGRAQSALAADELGGGRLSESADATDA